MSEYLTRETDGNMDAPTGAELRRIWDDAELFFTGGDRRHLHLYEDCRKYQQSETHLPKPAAVYPLGYQPLCKICVTVWRDRNE